MIIAIIVIISSTIGLIGFFTANPIMFYVGGAISFFDFIRDGVLQAITKDKAEIEKIKKNGYYQRMKSSTTYYAKTETEFKNLIRQFIIGNIIGRIIIYGLTFGLLFYFFLWNAFIWIGIVIGFGYIFELIKKILLNK